MVQDRASVRGGPPGVVASIAATGFGLTALCIGAQRGFISSAAATERVFAALNFLWKKLPNHRGFFYHWANINTGERVWESEISSVDTAILLCGILTCREYFRRPAVVELCQPDLQPRRLDLALRRYVPALTRLDARDRLPAFPLGLLQRADDDVPARAGVLGSSLEREGTWEAWKRLTFEYDGLRYIGSFAPLFVHQYSQAWFDFRGKRDKFADYFENSVVATEVHRRFCLELGQAVSRLHRRSVGDHRLRCPDTVTWSGAARRKSAPSTARSCPARAGGSLPFLPEHTLRVLKNIRTRYGSAWSKYGFVNAFNPLTNWYDPDAIAIDTGITMLMAENLRTGFVWQTFMKAEEAQRGMQRAGLKKY